MAMAVDESKFLKKVSPVITNLPSSRVGPSDMFRFRSISEDPQAENKKAMGDGTTNLED